MAGTGSPAGGGTPSTLATSAGSQPHAAQACLTEALANEWKGKVTVNAVLPSIIDTKTNRADMPDADFSTWVQPAAIADVIMFLASDQSRAITGALIPVTRGG